MRANVCRVSKILFVCVSYKETMQILYTLKLPWKCWENILYFGKEDYLPFLLMVLGFALDLLAPPRFFCFPRPLVFSFAFAARKSFFILGSTTLYRPFTPGGRTARFCALHFFATTYVTSFFGSWRAFLYNLKSKSQGLNWNCIFIRADVPNDFLLTLWFVWSSPCRWYRHYPLPPRLFSSPSRVYASRASFFSHLPPLLS